MKKVYLLLLFVFGFSAFAQQKGISYQAVIINPNSVAAPGYNGTSTPLANKAICLSFKIVNSANQVEYQESQSITTDGYGMVNVVIGTGTSGTGLVSTLEAVAWNQGNKKLVVGVNTEGVCSNYTEISNQVLNYTPYAYYALNSEIKDGSVTDPKVAMGINPAKVGLGNVNNTSDANKPISTATQTALDLKENSSNKSATITLGTSNVLFPTQNAVKTYVDSQISSATIVDADATTKGKIKLAGDLAGTADLPTVPGLALKADTSSLSTVATSGNYNDLTNKPSIPSAYALPTASASVLGGVKVGANLSIDTNGVLSAAASGNNASTLTGVVSIANGGTSTTSISGIKSILGLNTSKIAIGDQAGQTGQQNYTIALGAGAGASNQISGAIAIGGAAGGANQGSSSVAIGSNAGQANQSQRSVAVGFAAGQNNQGENAVAIGTFAGNNGQIANSIAINATGMSSPLNPTNAGFYVNPIRNASASNSLFYDPTTKEITYGSGSSGQSYVDLSTPQTIGGAKIFSSDLKINGLTFGKGAGSNNGVNTAIGASALASNTTGVYNTAIGFQVLTNNTTGNNNHALGFQVLAANTTGSRNTAFGEASLPRNTSGSDNVAIGLTALFRNTTADNNIAIGTQALGNSITGSNNVAIGSQTLTGNSTGSNNTAVGYQSLKETSGSDNTALGRLSLMGNTTGSFNTAIGSLADVNSNNLSNTTAIGYGARALANNTIQLGADGSSFVTNGVNIYTTAISNVRTSGSLTAGAVTYPNTNGTAGQVLTANNNGNASWTTIASVADASTMTGTVSVANGGTGATTAAAALTNLGAAPLASPTFTGTVTAPIYASTPQALTAGATISWNPANGLNASVTLDQNSTLSFTTTPTAGSYGTLVVTQDGTGNRTITLPSISNKVLGSTSTTTIALSSAANAKDILNFYYDGTNCYWNVGQGYGTAATSTLTATNIAGGAAGSIPYQTAAGATSLLAKGTDGQVLTLASGIPSWAAPSGGSSSGGHFVGEVYGGGIVFYVTSGGYHGLIASSTDIVANPMVIFDRATSPSYKYNTNSEDLYTDWVTPTFSQLNILYYARATTGLNLGSYFYISTTFTDNDSFGFKGLNFSNNAAGYANGNWSQGSSGGEIRGRAIRSF